MELDVYTLDAPDAGGSGSDASIDGATGTDALAEAGDVMLVPDDAGPDPWDVIVPVIDASCADAFGNDPINCGACGRSCITTACNKGVCAPSVVATGLSGPTEIAVNGAFVYWLDDNANKVSRIKKDGTGQTVTVFSETNSGYQRVAADDANVVVSHAPSNKVSVARVDAGKLNDTQAAGKPVGVAVDSLRAYWANADDGRVQATYVYSPGSAIDLTPGGSTKPNLVAVTGQHIYWAGANFVAGKGLGVNNFTYSKPLSVMPLDLQGYSSRVCWLTNSAIECEANPQFFPVQGQANLRRFAIDASGFYFTAQTTVLACPITGCGGQPPRVIANGQNDARGIGVDATYVYWADHNSGLILRAPK